MCRRTDEQTACISQPKADKSDRRVLQNSRESHCESLVVDHPTMLSTVNLGAPSKESVGRRHKRCREWLDYPDLRRAGTRSASSGGAGRWQHALSVFGRPGALSKLQAKVATLPSGPSKPDSENFRSSAESSFARVDSIGSVAGASIRSSRTAAFVSMLFR